MRLKLPRRIARLYDASGGMTTHSCYGEPEAFSSLLDRQEVHHESSVRSLKRMRSG